MKNFWRNMVLCLFMAALAAALGTRMHSAITESLKFYGPQPDDLKVIIFVLSIFSACVGISVFLLLKAFNWLIWCRKFKQEFGFKAPFDPDDSSELTFANRRAVEAQLDFTFQYRPKEKGVETALLAERFGIPVRWPKEFRQEFEQTHR